MTEKKAYLVTDLGPGEGGKGSIVHAIASTFRAHTIVKAGGGQGNHGFATSRGERFAVSHWGCGIFEGIHTHLSTGIIVSPVGILGEAEGLRYQAQIHDPFAILTLDENTLCATPFHGAASRLKELARRDNPRGTVGTGIGEAYRYHERLPRFSLFARDLRGTKLRDKLWAIRKRILEDVQPVLEGPFLPEDAEHVEDARLILTDDRYLNYIVQVYADCGRLVNIVPADYFADCLQKDGVVVIETSHGVLTDRYYGFHPHTSAIRTLPQFRKDLLQDAGYDGIIRSIGIHRAYEIRHGAGPMPTSNPALFESLLPGSCKDVDRWQGAYRVGPLDLVLMRYAIQSAGGPEAFDGIGITWFDQILQNKTWSICDSYRPDARDRDLFTAWGDLVVRHGEDAAQLEHTARLCQALLRVVPEVTDFDLSHVRSSKDQFDMVSSILDERLGVPVRLVSTGPTEVDKIFR